MRVICVTCVTCVPCVPCVPCAPCVPCVTCVMVMPTPCAAKAFSVDVTELWVWEAPGTRR